MAAWSWPPSLSLLSLSTLPLSSSSVAIAAIRLRAARPPDLHRDFVQEARPPGSVRVSTEKG